MINNRSYIIGGAIVATQKKWKEFYKLVCQCQIKTLRNNIVDDDQGVFIMCYYYNPKLIKLNYLVRTAGLIYLNYSEEKI